MTKRRFTDQQLYSLRNNIPVDALIEKVLGVPSRTVDGYFRFLCPLCEAFNTAVNPETNLARCFNCEKNFNTIDLVMTIRELDFVDSVRFLQQYHKSALGSRKNEMKCADRPGNPNNPVPIGYILDRLVSPECEKIPSGCKPSTDDRILILEQKVDLLSNQIENILKTIHMSNPSLQ